MKKGSKMECPTCNSKFQSDKINIKNNNAYCSICNAIYNLDDIVLTQVDSSYKDIKGPIDGIVELRDNDGYSIDITWSKFSNYKFHLTFGIIVTLFTLPFAVILLLKLEILGFSIVSLFALLGLYLLYIGLQEYFNKSILYFQGDNLYIYHQPINLSTKEIIIPKKNIKQAYVKKINVGSSNGVEHFKHEIYLTLENGIEQKIISLFKLERDAYHVERLIEKHLNIEDKITASEHRPGQGPNQDHIIKIARAMQKVKEARKR